VKPRAKPVLVLDDPSFDAHAWPDHPERPERRDAARAGLFAAIPEDVRREIRATRASRADLERVHAPAYVERLDAAVARGRGKLDADTYYCEGTAEAMAIASGGAAEMARRLLEGEARSGFALLRPPGHHAERARPMGFCLLNHVAVAAAHALARGAERVAIVDFDVHHGNGTQAIFEEDPRVLFTSLHQWPLYPGTGRHDEIGRGAGIGTSANVALPPRSGSEIYGEAFRRLVLPLLDAFAPTLVLVSAGFDAHARDPLGGLELEAATYGAMASALLDRGTPTGFLLEGGYDLVALEESTRAVGRAMLGERTELPEGAPRREEREALERTIGALSPHWATLRER
jgi:acetoin utilization deacetylase AcuC-like enzyme